MRHTHTKYCQANLKACLPQVSQMLNDKLFGVIFYFVCDQKWLVFDEARWWSFGSGSRIHIAGDFHCDFSQITAPL